MIWITPQHLLRIPKEKSIKGFSNWRNVHLSLQCSHHIYSSENFSTQSVLKLAVENVIPVTWEFSIQGSKSVLYVRGFLQCDIAIKVFYSEVSEVEMHLGLQLRLQLFG